VSSTHDHQQQALFASAPPHSADFSAEAAAAALRKSAVFLPDYDCRLVASLSFVDPETGSRPLYSCVRPECGCAGVFFKDCGGSGCQLRLRIWIEVVSGGLGLVADGDSLAPACSGLQIASDVRSRLESFFTERPPEVTLFYGRAACTETVSSLQTRKWLPDARRLGGGVWEVTFRPSRITGEGILACLKATVGPNVLWTPGMELRTKPSEWIMLHRVPTSLDEAGVRSLLASCSHHAPSAVVLRRSPVGGCAAFVRFESRTVACGALLGWKALVGGRVKGGTLPESCRAISISLLISLNRPHKDDEALSSILVPKCDITEVVQQQERPGYLPPPPARVQSVLPVIGSSPLKRPASPVAVLPVEEPEDDDDSCVVLPAPTKRQCVEEDEESEFYDSDDSDEDTDVGVVLPLAIRVPWLHAPVAPKSLDSPLFDGCIGSPASSAGDELAAFLGLDDAESWSPSLDFAHPDTPVDSLETAGDFDSWLHSLCAM